VFKSPENKNHADKNYYQINKKIQRILHVLKKISIKICPEIEKYFFEKMWFYMKYIVKNRR
jgi:DNA-binding PadR family transcriptional regulator